MEPPSVSFLWRQRSNDGREEIPTEEESLAPPLLLQWAHGVEEQGCLEVSLLGCIVTSSAWMDRERNQTERGMVHC